MTWDDAPDEPRQIDSQAASPYEWAALIAMVVGGLVLIVWAMWL